MDFRLLQTRLIAHVRARVRNGELSERGLARLTGISQPHIHNVLKGARLLSMDMADQILQSLRINLADLVTAGDAGSSPRQENAAMGECRTVALLDGWIGPGYPFPQLAGRERYPFLVVDLERLASPAAARLAPDPLRASIFSGPGVVLLDRSEGVRLNPDEEGYYGLDLSGGGTIGLVRRAGRQLYLWARHAEVWQSIPLPDRNPLDVIQGRVSLVVRRL